MERRRRTEGGLRNVPAPVGADSRPGEAHPPRTRWRIRLARYIGRDQVIRFLGPETPYGVMTQYKAFAFRPGMEVVTEFEVRDVERDQCVENVARIAFTNDGLTVDVDHERPEVQTDASGD